MQHWHWDRNTARPGLSGLWLARTVCQVNPTVWTSRGNPKREEGACQGRYLPRYFEQGAGGPGPGTETGDQHARRGTVTSRSASSIALRF